MVAHTSDAIARLAPVRGRLNGGPDAGRRPFRVANAISFLSWARHEMLTTELQRSVDGQTPCVPKVFVQAFGTLQEHRIDVDG